MLLNWVIVKKHQRLQYQFLLVLLGHLYIKKGNPSPKNSPIYISWKIFFVNIKLELSLFLYNIIVRLYHLAIIIASYFNPKAKKWIIGRKGIFDLIKLTLKDNNSPIAWFHCASLGEFEQARPVIEKFTSPPLDIPLTPFDKGESLSTDVERGKLFWYNKTDSHLFFKCFTILSKNNLISKSFYRIRLLSVTKF
ncbi:MAG: hypothetical protein IIA88_06475 [Bacteroidetes bacterium]|nr:hypothetical protein [Bacteroidota bacterium]